MDMDSDQPIFSVKAYSLQFAPQNIHRCNTSNPQYLQSIKSREYSTIYTQVVKCAMEVILITI